MVLVNSSRPFHPLIVSRIEEEEEESSHRHRLLVYEDKVTAVLFEQREVIETSASGGGRGCERWNSREARAVLNVKQLVCHLTFLFTQHVALCICQCGVTEWFMVITGSTTDTGSGHSLVPKAVRCLRCVDICPEGSPLSSLCRYMSRRQYAVFAV